MQIHQIKPLRKKKKEKRVGRGGKRGTYSGRGIKGQKARAGRKFQPIIRAILKKYPKLRGYKFSPQKKEMAILNLEVLEKEFKEGERVTPKILVERKIIRKIKGRVPPVKILGRGEISKKLIIEKCLLSESAREKIEKVGGEVVK
ncbi:MAG: uL15 family ribosomal protein [Candidatus Pacebacteria bacterium]|nr:uL15 family ribosomal protein [Candidatus Paceibacterota bacterium]